MKTGRRNSEALKKSLSSRAVFHHQNLRTGPWLVKIAPGPMQHSVGSGTSTGAVILWTPTP